MALSFPLSTTSPMRKTCVNLPIKNSSLPPSCNTKIESLKDFCKQANLSAAVESFSAIFVDRNRVGFCPVEAYAAMTELCGSLKALSVAQQVHAHFITSGTVSDSVFLNTKLVMMYGKCESVENAQNVFDEMSQRTTFTWNAMIGAFISTGDSLNSLRLYRGMRDSGISLDAYTFPSVLKGCGALQDIRTGVEIHGIAIKYGYISVGFVVNALVTMYSKCNDLDAARLLFDRIAEKDDVVLWNSMISMYSGRGSAVEAVSEFFFYI